VHSDTLYVQNKKKQKKTIATMKNPHVLKFFNKTKIQYSIKQNNIFKTTR
jgi:hypothetical protein